VEVRLAGHLRRFHQPQIVEAPAAR